MRHFTQTMDFTKEDYLAVFKRGAYFQDGGKADTLCSGKVIATMFFKESTRTQTSAQAAMIKLGGGWVGISGTAGTYLATGEEDVGDFLHSYADVSDIMVVRHNDVDLPALAKDFPIPLINGMCGGDEHASGSAGIVYTMWRRKPDLENAKIGILGMSSASRPMKALYRILGQFNATIYEDPLVDYFTMPAQFSDYAKSKGATVETKPWGEWIGDVDFFIVVEGLPQKGADETKVEEFNKIFRTINQNDLNKMKEGAAAFAIMPRTTTDGRLTVAKETDSSPRNVSFTFLHDWQYFFMGLITHLLEIPVETK